MFNIPVGFFANQGIGSWTNWTGVADGANYPLSAITGGTISSGILSLNSTQFIMFYNYSPGGNNIFECVIGTISGTSVSYGTSATIMTQSGFGFSLPNVVSSCLIASGTVITTFSTNNGISGTDVYAIPITVSGTSISIGTLLNITNSGLANQNEPTDITALTSTTAAITYIASSIINIIVVTYSGGSLTAGTPVNLGLSLYKRPSITSYTSGSVLLSFSYGNSTTENINAQVLTISGSTITISGGMYQVDTFTGTSANSITINISNAVMSSNSVILSYIANDSGSAIYTQKCSYLTISGTTITPQPPVIINASATISLVNAWLEPLNANNAMVTYGYNNAVTNAKILTLVGSTVTVGSSVQIQSTPQGNSNGSQSISIMDSMTVISQGHDSGGFTNTKVLKVS